jgi:uncharacterized Rmd1/YagE family protein
VSAIESLPPSQKPFEGREKIHVRSLCVGGDIDTRALRKARNLSTSPLTLEAGRCGCAIIFRYGAVVLFHVEPMEESTFLAGMRAIIQRPASDPMVEEIEIPDRFEAVEAKLNMIGRTIQTSIDLVQNRRSMRVEWYIVILIVVEIVLTLYEMFIRGR